MVSTQLNNEITDRLRNMGAELPLLRIFHTIPWSRKTHVKMTYVLRTHGFGWQIRNTGRSASILLWQSCLGAPRGRGYRLQVLDKIKINLLNFWIWPYGFEIKKNRYFLTTMIHTFNFKYMSQYTSAFPDIPLNEIPSTSKPCNLSTGIPNVRLCVSTSQRDYTDINSVGPWVWLYIILTWLGYTLDM